MLFDGVISCGRCDKKQYQKCAHVSDSLYDLLIKQEEGVHWYCPHCNLQAMQEVKMGNLIEEKCQLMEARIEEIKKELESKFEKKIKSVKKDITKVKDDMIAQENRFKTQIDDKLEDCTENTISELKERELRRQNMLFFNIQESNGETADTRKQQDMAEVVRILGVIDVTCEVTKPIRLGKKGEKPRPIRVRVDRSQDRRDIMENAKKLKNLGEDVFINRDQTPLERSRFKLLLMERKKRNSEEKEKQTGRVWIIRKGKLEVQDVEEEVQGVEEEEEEETQTTQNETD